MKAIDRHRQTWQGKSDEWIFERLDNELKQKVEEIHRLLSENEALRKSADFNRTEHLTAFTKWLSENHSIEIHDMVLQDYLNYGG